MKAAYVDTSCLVATALAHPGAAAVAKRLSVFDSLHSANLLEAELKSVLKREGLLADSALLHRIVWVMPDRQLDVEIEQVLDAGYVRGADCWHLACALYLAEDPEEMAFLTLDTRQLSVARKLGFQD